LYVFVFFIFFVVFVVFVFPSKAARQPTQDMRLT